MKAILVLEMENIEDTRLLSWNCLAVDGEERGDLLGVFHIPDHVLGAGDEGMIRQAGSVLMEPTIRRRTQK